MRSINFVLMTLIFWVICGSSEVNQHNDDHHDHDGHEHNDDHHDHDGHEHNDDHHDHDHEEHEDHHDHEHNDDHHDHEHNDESHKSKPMIFWISVITSLLIVWSASLIGSALPKKFVLKHNRKFIAFCVGTLLCSIFAEFLPHATSEAIKLRKQFGNHKALAIYSWSVFGGLFMAFLLESVVHLTSEGHLHGHQGCGNDCEELSTKSGKKKTETARPGFIEEIKQLPSFVIVDLIAKLVHHFVDGALIGSMYVSGLVPGVSVSLSILVHEVSVHIGSFSLYIFSGLSKKLSVCICIFGSSTLIVGGLLTSLMKEKLKASGAIGYISFIALGLFMYLTLADLLPLLLHEEHGVHSKEVQVEKSNVLKIGWKKKGLEIFLLVLSFLTGFFCLFAILHLLPHEH